MTVRPSVPAIDAPDIEAAIDALREQGMRVSAARRLILEALYAARGPLSAEGIAGGLNGRLPSSDIAGVYRNLEAFERTGLVRHFHLGHGPGLYVLAGRDDAEYVVCDSCGEILTLDRGALDDVRALIRKRFGYEAAFNHFPVVGRCPKCAGPASSKGAQ
jgi:Fur family ferric uptake transcriptional regulator